MRDLDKGSSKSQVQSPFVSARLKSVIFLGVCLARFEDGFDLTAEGPLEECRSQGGVLAHGSGLNLSVLPRSTRLGARGDWDVWDGLLIHARLDHRWR